MRLFTYIVRALCAIAAGFLLVSNPTTMADLLIQVVGGLFVLSGLTAFIGYFSSKINRGSALRPVFPLVGVGSLAFGTVLIAWPTQFKEIFMYVVGALLILVGLAQMWSLVSHRKVAPLSFSLFLVPLLIVTAAGVMIVLYPTESASLPFTIFGVAFIFYGVSELLLGVRLWRFQKAYDAQFIEAEEVTEAEEATGTAADASGSNNVKVEIPEAVLTSDSNTSSSSTQRQQ